VRSDPRRHVRAGQPLSLAAEQVNWINEQMRGNPGFGGGALSLPQAPYWVLPCHNATATAFARWGGVRVTGLAALPNDSGTAGTPQFQRTPVITGGALTAGATQWGVAVEPIKADAIGMVAVAGVVQAKVRVAATTDIAVGAEAAGLRSGPIGEARILWKQSGTGNKWALLHLGAGQQSYVNIVWDGSWTINTTKTATIDGTAEQIPVRNLFATISGSCGLRKGGAARFGSEWFLVATQVS